MLELAFLLLFSIVPLISFFLLKAAGERINYISLINIVALAIYVFSIVGILPLFYHWDTYRVDIGVVDQNLIFMVLIYSSINIIFLLIGVVLARRALRIRGSVVYGLMSPLNGRGVLSLFVLFSLSVGTLFFYVYQLESIALFVALSDGVSEATLSRSLMGNDFSGKYHWYHLFMHEVSQFISYVFFANFLVSKTTRSFAYFFISFLFTSFIALMATEKGPMAWFLVGMFFTHLLAMNKGLIPLRIAFKFFIIVLASLMLMYFIFMGSSDLFAAFFSVFSRAFTGGITPAYFYLEYFPHVQEYLMGGTLPNPGGILPFTPVRYDVDVMNWVFPSLASTGVVGSMPTVFWGEAYANFGPLAIPVVAVVVGVLLVVIDRVINQFEWSSLSAGFMVWVIMHYKNLSGTGFSSFLIDMPFIVMFFFFLSILLCAGSLRRANIK